MVQIEYYLILLKTLSLAITRMADNAHLLFVTVAYQKVQCVSYAS